MTALHQKPAADALTDSAFRRYRSDEDLLRQAAAADTEDDVSLHHVVVYADCREVVEQQEAAMRNVVSFSVLPGRQAWAHSVPYRASAIVCCLVQRRRDNER